MLVPLCPRVLARQSIPHVLQSVVHLMLSGNSATHSGITALCQGVAQNGSLATLHVDHNDLREAGLKAVLKALEGNAGIAYMRLDSTNSPEALRIAADLLLEARRDA